MSAGRVDPGPWTLADDSHAYAPPCVCVMEQGNIIAEVLGNDAVDDETRAAARLIAKAPNMLALLKDCEESFTADDSYALLRGEIRKLIAEIDQ